MNNEPKLLNAEGEGRSATGSQSAILEERNEKSDQRNTEKNRRNETDKDRADLGRADLSFCYRTDETEVATASAGVYQSMSGMIDREEPREK